MPCTCKMLESRKHKIKQVHRAPRSPTTQGLVEHNNRLVKENTNNIINENNDEKANWCKILNEAAYKKNIVEHSATGKTPYEVVFGILPWQELHIADPTEEKPGNESITNPKKMKHEENHTQRPQRKQLKTDINERQLSYNTKMRVEAKLRNLMLMSLCVSNSIARIRPYLYNLMIWLTIIEVEDDYAKIVTKPFGRLKTCISMNRLNKCTTLTNINPDYTKEIMFSAGCRKAAQRSCNITSYYCIKFSEIAIIIENLYLR